MPVEGQWRRTSMPLSRRDKRVLAAALGIAAVAVTVLGIVLGDRSAAPSNAGCLVVDVPSTMGGARLRNCGAAAHAFCHAQGARNATIAAACRRQGYLADLHP